ncbi:hypothetical protein [Streptomyces doebereineriae]|uniref:hypothetical protein n=1 Tax=Streptomyces doebereineriae TaxID=3075528 RepID=UPI00374DFF3B
MTDGSGPAAGPTTRPRSRRPRLCRAGRRRNLPIGTRLRILPDHACATAAQHHGHHVVDGAPRCRSALRPVAPAISVNCGDFAGHLGERRVKAACNGGGWSRPCAGPLAFRRPCPPWRHAEGVTGVAPMRRRKVRRGRGITLV